MNLNVVVIISFLFLHLYLFGKIGLSDLNKIKVDFFDVGQGSSVLITTQNNCKVLVDTGKNLAFLNGFSKIYPIRNTKIDLLILTHTDYDHIGDFENVFEFFSPDFLLLNNSFKNSQKSKDLKLYSKKTNIVTAFAKKGDVFDLCGLRAYVLNPNLNISKYKNENEKSITILFELNNRTNLLVTGDLEKESKYLDLQFLKEKSQNKFNLYLASHHGSKTSSDHKFLSAYKPLLSFVQAGIDNSYGHPHPEIIKRICQYSQFIFNTQVNGFIRVSLPSYISEKTIERRKLTIETQKGQPMECELE